MGVISPKARQSEDTLDLSASTESTAIEIRYYRTASIQLVWSGLDTSTGVASVQASNDRTNWSTYPGSSVTLIAPAGSQVWELTVVASRYIRIVFLAGTNSTGTATLLFEGSID